MNYYIEYLKDSVGNNYIGINITYNVVEPFLDKLKEILGDEFDIYIKNQKDRDHGRYHITVINVMEYNSLSKSLGMDKFVNSLNSIFSFEISDLKLIGVGTAHKNNNRSYFIVAKSNNLEEMRKKYNLPPHDFHVTLGFKYKDVHGVRKNEVLPSEGMEFLKLLKREYYKKNESFNFIRSIENFDLDESSDILPIKIEDQYATFRIGMNYFTISLVNNEFMVTNKWQDEEQKIIPNTIIARIFKDK